jgi:hypothetical protein
VRALEVVDLDLDAARSGGLQAVDQLDADRAAVLLEPQAAHVLAAHEAEVAVDVADRQPEGEAHRGCVDGADDPALQRVGAVALVALHPVDAIRDVLGEANELRGVVLAVAVRVEDPVAAGLAQRGSQGAAVAPVPDVLDDPQPRLARGDLRKPLERVVGGAVVDDDYLALEPDLVECPRRPIHEAGDRPGVVVTEQARRDRVAVAQASAPHTRSTSSSLISG